MQTVKASPYASCVTVTNGTVQFYLNEDGGNVTVTYEDGSTNASFNGQTTGLAEPKGVYSFSLGVHTGYAISVYKLGTGVPFQISNDASNNAVWGTPRGMAVNQNAQVGRWFGRIYVGNGGNNNIGTAIAKYHGLYALNSDLSDALGQGTNAFAQSLFATESSSGPFKLRVAPDNRLIENDWAGNGALYLFSPDLDSSNAVFLANQPPGIHGDKFGTPDLLINNVQGTNYYTLWCFDSGMGVPSTTATLGPNTSYGEFNDAERYDLGANPTFPWTNGPNYAFCMGLGGIAELITEGDIGKDGKIICGFGRHNLSNPEVQILSPDGSTYLWDSWHDTGGGSDPWIGVNGNSELYCGIRVSPDGRFLASVDLQNGILVANLTNGLPDDASLFGILNAPSVGNSRGMDWDAADNVYVCSSGQGLLRSYSLGLTTTCITSNDITGTNGSFYFILPPVTASVAATTPQASQNYVNNASPGTPIPGVFTISLNTNALAAPAVVNFGLSGTAKLGTNYTITTGTDANGVIITTTNVTFPAGAFPGGPGNWSANLIVTPTATPISGPTLTVGIRVIGGAILAGTPETASMTILNTGPQLLLLTPASFGTTMSRNVTNDYAQFVITRWGDLNGPGNSAGSVTPKSYTVTNFNYGGTAAFPGDYMAQAQAYQFPLQNGSPGVVVNSGVVTVTNVVGNPVRHSNLSVPPSDVTIVISMTNSVTGTNATSEEGYTYSVSPNTVTLTEIDNAVGPEVVLWSDSLNNSSDSTNWTLTFAATNMAGFPVPPVVIPNYTNDESAKVKGGTNDFRVEFGNPIASDGNVPQSPEMAANGWLNALRMTVNKDSGANGAQAAVNLYPQGTNFAGNYALRFNMFLSMYSGAINDPFVGTVPYEFALFGINHTGTNCNWRTAFSIGANPGFAAPTNADGVWFALDAGYGSISPADFDAFTSPALPNSGVGADYQSSSAAQETGVFKSPPFASEGATSPGLPPGGEPINQWVDVSVEVTKSTNVSVYINRSKVIPSFTLTNGGGNYTSGKPMLGYLDAWSDESDNSAFAYYSNVRIVELSPDLIGQPTSVITTNGANVSFTSTASYSSPPLTNTWYSANGSVPTASVQTNTSATSSLTSALSLNNVLSGTNYLAVFSDAAGSSTSAVVSLEVVTTPVNVSVLAGTNVQFSVAASGEAAPTYQWKFNNVNLANSAHYAGVTTSTLTITNVQLRDGGTYSVAAVNAAGTVTPGATLTVTAPQPDITSVSRAGTNTVMSFTTTDPYDNTGSFTLQSSINVQGPYVNTTGVLVGGSGVFQFTTPGTNATMFYRLVHN
ncbi:MAG TPA: immunoglobulin domain-containing protein [Verrucomicrobiae bacterium]|nr:immunoglobulin domain-containing protein [Verrucomicrobiae bacterium]